MMRRGLGNNAVNRSTAETVGAGVLSQLIVVASGILVARMLGVENRGHFALIALLPLVLSQGGTLGLPVAITFYVARGVSPRELVRATQAQIAIQTSVLFLVHVGLAFLLFRTDSKEVKEAAAISLAVTPPAVVQLWAFAVLQGNRRFRSFNVLRLVGGATYSAGLLAIFLAQRGTIVAVTLAWLLSSVISCAASCGYAYHRLRRASAVQPPPSVGKMYRFGLKGLLGSVFPVETFQLDQFYVGLVLSPTALGLYVVGTAFTNLTRFFIPQSLGVIAYPQAAAAKTSAAARRTVWHFFALTIVLCGTVVGVLELAVGWVLPLLFGAHFSESVPVTRILLLGSLFLAGRRVLAEGSRGAGLPGMGALSEVVLIAVAIPALAVVGDGGLISVAWALTFAYGASLALMMVATVAALAPRSDRAMPGWKGPLGNRIRRSYATNAHACEDAPSDESSRRGVSAEARAVARRALGAKQAKRTGPRKTT